MKLFVKFLVFVLVLGVSGLFVLKRPDGKPWLDYRVFLNDIQTKFAEVKSLKKDLVDEVKDVAGGSEPQSTTVYKWRDAAGVVQYSDTPPPDGSGAVMVLNHATNIVQGTSVSARETAAPTKNPSVTYLSKPEQDASQNDSMLKGGLENVMHDAKQVQGLLDQRKALQDSYGNE